MNLKVHGGGGTSFLRCLTAIPLDRRGSFKLDPMTFLVGSDKIPPSTSDCLPTIAASTARFMSQDASSVRADVAASLREPCEIR